jgi:hypothetical protein
MMIMELLVQPYGIVGAEKFPLVTESGNMARRLKVDMATVPDGAEREDALKSGWLDISPYWEEPYILKVNADGILEYIKAEVEK